MKHYWIMALLLALMTAACAKQQVGITTENAAKITSSTVILVVAQKDLGAVVEASKAGIVLGGGMMAALVNAADESSRSRAARDMVLPLRAHLTDIDFRKELASELSKQLQHSWLHVEQVEIVDALSSSERKKMFDKRSSNAILLVDANYKLASDFTLLNTTSNHAIYIEDAKDPVYKDKVAISSDKVMDASAGESAIARSWAENDGSRIKLAVRDGIKKLAAAIAKGLVLPSKEIATESPAASVH